MTVINLDDKILKTKEFELLGKKHKVELNDATQKLLSDTQIEVGRLLNDASKNAPEDESISLSEEQDYAFGALMEIKDVLIDFFNKFFDDNTGNDFYAKYQSSTLLMSVFGTISDECNEVLRKSKAQGINEYVNRQQRRAKK
ncbi:hypothetical protein [Pediococcus pentosaceus]|uniref:hypothetical protein n=1 Tax=Pediococcus pentosaceus TaxID=1255 RepID=UPI002FBE3312